CTTSPRYYANGPWFAYW
nr:immunoglobulin heavy chain junction region [Mus musculus]MBK4196975.1 immunoglobulin heavy chain junction region [Mus musculus]